MLSHIVRLVTALLILLVAATVAPARAAVSCDQKPGVPRPAGDRGGKDEANKDDGRPHPYKFWVDGRAELGITDQQAASIEQIWQASLSKLHMQREQLEQLEGVLSKMILDGADESPVSAQIDRVEAVRSELNKARTLMLYRMNRQLTADQRTKLKAMHDRWEASRKK